MNLSKLAQGREASVDHLLSLVQGELRGRVKSFQLLIGAKGIVLEGRTNSYYAKQLAQHTVMRLTDLPVTANDIEVIECNPSLASRDGLKVAELTRKETTDVSAFS
jgi:hypothetical protein